MVRRSALSWAFVALLMVSIPVPVGTAQGGPPGLRISELFSDPETGGREFVELWNPTAGPVELMGWSLRDATTSNKVVFPAWTLSAGGRVVAWSGGGADAAGPAFSSSTVWNNAGDAATLAAPDGSVVDWVSYGDGAGAQAPAGFGAGMPVAKPAKGRSLALVGGSWGEADPSPGMSPDSQGGGVEAEVENVPPRPLFVDPPETARPGAAVPLRFEVADPNGGDDVASWQLSDGAGVLASGSTGGLLEEAPVAGAVGVWVLILSATDRAGASAEATLSIAVQEPGLHVGLPEGGRVRFPPLRPGDRGIETLDGFTLSNDGDSAVRPLFDISPLTAGASVIPVLGNLEVGIAVGSGPVEWIPYPSPLLALPELAPGAEARLLLRIVAVPAPLASGSYGTSFTVVAA